MPLPPVVQRFLRYVQIDTQSDASSSSVPSTEKQKTLGRLLCDELQAMGLTDALMDRHGYVYATLPSTLPDDREHPRFSPCLLTSTPRRTPREPG